MSGPINRTMPCNRKTGRVLLLSDVIFAHFYRTIPISVQRITPIAMHYRTRPIRIPGDAACYYRTKNENVEVGPITGVGLGSKCYRTEDVKIPVGWTGEDRRGYRTHN